MNADFSSNQIAILTLLVFGAAFLQRLNKRDINKIQSKYIKEQEMNSQNNFRYITDYLGELSRLQADYSLIYFYLILIAVTLVNLYTK